MVSNAQHRCRPPLSVVPAGPSGRRGLGARPCRRVWHLPPPSGAQGRRGTNRTQSGGGPLMPCCGITGAWGLPVLLRASLPCTGVPCPCPRPREDALVPRRCHAMLMSSSPQPPPPVSNECSFWPAQDVPVCAPQSCPDFSDSFSFGCLQLVQTFLFAASLLRCFSLANFVRHFISPASIVFSPPPCPFLFFAPLVSSLCGRLVASLRPRAGPDAGSASKI